MTNFGTMRYKHIISVVLWSMFLVACGPDRRVALAEKLMAEKETDSAIAVMQEIKEPQNNPVSYTHLDVYKRQVLFSTHRFCHFFSISLKLYSIMVVIILLKTC